MRVEYRNFVYNCISQFHHLNIFLFYSVYTVHALCVTISCYVLNSILYNVVLHNFIWIVLNIFFLNRNFVFLLQTYFLFHASFGAPGDKAGAMQRRHSSNTEGMPPERLGFTHILSYLYRFKSNFKTYLEIHQHLCLMLIAPLGFLAWTILSQQV